MGWRAWFTPGSGLNNDALRGTHTDYTWRHNLHLPPLPGDAAGFLHVHGGIVQRGTILPW